jgi:phosphoadenosine phosphosulfate reductase
MTKEEIIDLNKKFADKNPIELISYFLDRYKDKIALASSLGAEDQVLTQMITSIDTNARIFTLDTGRLFPETYELIDRTSKKYKTNLEVYFPQAETIQSMVQKKGINLFYDSIENRKECCYNRKIEPLKRAFKGLEAWICGLRAEQSVTRTDIQLVEWDENNQIVKINPLAQWTEKDLWDYINEKGIPYNPLHNKNYPSIGCQPCTRAILPGEDIRAGRWYWENPDTKECGLHKK